MTSITSLKNYQLSTRQAINTTSNMETKKSYDLMYEDIASKANEVSPREAKARIVKNTPVKFVTTPIKDTFKDVKNFTKATSTGRISDNNLGRLNDLGLKVGAIAIAGFLASRATTATNAIMQFVGGGAFIASMSLWPKLFINLPAKLVHGFPIDQKYISAQGDKKDFYLDNQFIPWDAMKEEDKRQYAQNAEIDYDSKNGKEKIERKMQKTALQNRTLALLTSTLGVPLMTSLSCSKIQPVIYNQVVKHNYGNAKNAVSSNMEGFFSLIKPEPRNQIEIHNLFAEYQTKQLDNAFFNQLADLLKIDDIFKDFVDPDDLTAVSKYNTYNLAEQLKNFQESNSHVSVSEIIEKIKIAFGGTELPESAIDDLKDALKDKTVAQAIHEVKDNKVVKQTLSSNEIDNIFSSLQRTDNKTFFRYMEYFNNDVVGQTRARLKAFLKTMNAVVGSKSESVYTKEYADVMKKMFKAFKLPYKSKNPDIVSLKNIAKAGSDEECAKLLSRIFENRATGVAYGSEEYGKLISEFTFRTKDKKLSNIVGWLQQNNNLEAISAKPKKLEGILGNPLAINEAIVGGSMKQNNLMTVIKNFIRRKEIDLNATKAHAIICTNFETRVLNDSFEHALRNKGLLKKFSIKNLSGEYTPVTFEQLKESARSIVYDGKFSRVINGGTLLSNDAVFKELYDIIYDKEAFSYECKNVAGFEEILTNLKENVKDYLDGGIPKDSNARAASFAFKIKDQAAKIYNNKTWMRIFAPMAIILTISTLLIQPLFGNIKNEFPDEENKEGGKK